MKLSEFDYVLPGELIAQQPSKERDQSRLLVVHNEGELEDDIFSNLTSHLRRGDLLVINNSKVFPARLLGQKSSGGKFEILLSKNIEGPVWESLGRNLVTGEELSFVGSSLMATVLSKDERICRIKFNLEGGRFFSEIEKIGRIPLPPYIKRGENTGSDRERYQTIYAKDRGSVAAPTAGLHFSKKLFSEVKKKGAEIAEVTLHVGLGTFMPVESEDIEDHKIHSEYYSIGQEQYDKIILAKKEGRRVIAVGTTTARTLETLFSSGQPTLSGWTNIFIYPGFTFKCIDGLITNFHLPKSSLLMLVSALVGRERLFKSYDHAIKNKYRFYSYGDAMLII